ncbi:MAG TPA: DUF72 domain-containing protein [Flavobacteriales bacterium]|nr:DUF72 domain-containing protein [Flavobacteriales bacterium]HIO16227.1 DUF72 domain-containing protein [Flavobacteriales bacterium]
MKFGKLESWDELEGIDWKLPDCKIEWAKPLNGNAFQGSTKVRSGGTMWTVRPWRGKVYPEKDPMRTWPSHYGRQFGSLEFNATHYRIYPPEKMAAWAAEMPDHFIFCPKFPAIITHYRRFGNCESPTDDFIDGILALGDKLGPAFLQLPPHYAPKHSEKLALYLKSWPRDLKMAVEFRHPDWFSGSSEAESIWKLMSERGIGAVISDTAGRRDALHMRLTAPFLLVRFGGYDSHESDEIRLRFWAEKIAELIKKGTPLESFDLLVHTSDSVTTPETCRLFSKLVKDYCDIDVKKPLIIF